MGPRDGGRGSARHGPGRDERQGREESRDPALHRSAPERCRRVNARKTPRGPRPRAVRGSAPGPRCDLPMRGLEGRLAGVADGRAEMPGDPREDVDDAPDVRDANRLPFGRSREGVGNSSVRRAVDDRLGRGHAAVELHLLARGRVVDDDAGGLVGAREERAEHDGGRRRRGRGRRPCRSGSSPSAMIGMPSSPSRGTPRGSPGAWRHPCAAFQAGSAAATGTDGRPPMVRCPEVREKRPLPAGVARYRARGIPGSAPEGRDGLREDLGVGHGRRPSG